MSGRIRAGEQARKRRAHDAKIGVDTWAVWRSNADGPAATDFEPVDGLGSVPMDLFPMPKEGRLAETLDLLSGGRARFVGIVPHGTPLQRGDQLRQGDRIVSIVAIATDWEIDLPLGLAEARS